MDSSAKKNWAVWIVASLTFINGFLSVAQILFSRFREPPEFLTRILPYGYYHWSRSLTLALGFALIYLSFNLFERKKTAWYLATSVSILEVINHISRAHISIATLSTLSAVFLLLSWKKYFTVRSEPRSMVLGVGFMIFILLIAALYGTVGFWLLDAKDFGINFNLSDALTRALKEFFLIGNSDLVAKTKHAERFLESLRLLGLVAGVFAAYSLFRPIAYRLRTLPRERETAKKILEQYGRSSLDYFKLWPDKSYFFSEDRKCFIAYKTAGGTAFSLGDPAGPDDRREEIIRNFLAFCSDNGWNAVFFQILPDIADVYQKMGFKLIKMGEEAIVDLERFSNITSKRKKIRKLLRRFEREGYKFHHYDLPHTAWRLNQLEEVSREWLSIPGRRERSFSVGKFERSYIEKTTIFSVSDPAGKILAFVNEIPSYREGEATIDLMRHRREVPNGIMDYLFLKIFANLKERKYVKFNLGLAPLSKVGDEPGAAMEERAIHFLFEHLNNIFSFKGLREYKAKYDPGWEERFLAYKGGAPSLLRTVIALIKITED